MKRPIRSWTCGALVLASCLAWSARGQCFYEVVQVIKVPQCGILESPTIPTAMNQHGQACGYYNPCAAGKSQPWVWYGPDDLRLLMPPGGYSGAAQDIADDGTVVGYFYLNTGPRRGFIYHPSTNQYTVLHPASPGGWCQATAINNRGQVVGDRSLTDDPTLFQAFVWENGTFTDLGVLQPPRSSALDISNAGVIAGWSGEVGYQSSYAMVGVTDTLSLLPSIPGGYTSGAEAINEGGNFAGAGRELGGTSLWRQRAMARINGQLLNLGALPPARHSDAHGLNEASEIVGRSFAFPPYNSGSHPTLWRGDSMYDLKDWIQPDPGLSNHFYAVDISDDGRILLQSYDSLGDLVACIISPLTESSADLDHDCAVNVEDLLLVINNWGPGESWADITEDGAVDVDDLFVVLRDWSV